MTKVYTVSGLDPGIVEQPGRAIAGTAITSASATREDEMVSALVTKHVRLGRCQTYCAPISKGKLARLDQYKLPSI